MKVGVSMVEVSLPDYPDPFVLPPCRVVMVRRLFRTPQFWHYDPAKEEVRLVRVNNRKESDI